MISHNQLKYFIYDLIQKYENEINKYFNKSNKLSNLRCFQASKWLVMLRFSTQFIGKFVKDIPKNISDNNMYNI